MLFVLVYVGLLFLADPLGMLCCCAELWGNALHAMCNAFWLIFKAFLAGLEEEAEIGTAHDDGMEGGYGD